MFYCWATFILDGILTYYGLFLLNKYFRGTFYFIDDKGALGTSNVVYGGKFGNHELPILLHVRHIYFKDIIIISTGMITFRNLI